MTHIPINHKDKGLYFQVHEISITCFQTTW